MDCWTEKSMDTLFKGIKNLNERMPDHELLGTKVQNEETK